VAKSDRSMSRDVKNPARAQLRVLMATDHQVDNESVCEHFNVQVLTVATAAKT